METHLLAPVAMFRAYQPCKSGNLQHVRETTFARANPWFTIEELSESQEMSFSSMGEIPLAVLIGAGMILLGTAVAIWMVLSIIRQNRKDQSFPD
jgi:hypothetical protein